MSASYRSALPSLRQNCDANVQIAFQEERWTQVITYAKQQFKRTHDPYYEAIEIAARSQLDTPTDQRAAFAAVEKILADGKPIKDYWIIELYDWACAGVDKDYAKTIGTLRATFVKEAWKPDVDKASAAVRQFYACVLNHDWENAQKIAAIVDQKFPKEPRHQFYNIVAYYMLSSQLSSKDPKGAMFRTLATRIIDKARDLRDNTPASADYPPRAIATEEELLLWLRIQISCAKDEAEIIALLKKPEFSALKRLSEGSVSVFKEIMCLLEQHEAWEELFNIAQELFDKALAYIVETTNAESSNPVPIQDVVADDDEILNRMQDVLRFAETRSEELGKSRKETESRAFQSAVMDWSLWKQFVTAAQRLNDEEKALKQLRSFVVNVSKVMKVHPIYKKQLDIAHLMILFMNYPTGVSGPSGSSTEEGDAMNSRVEHLMTYTISNYKMVSCFDDLKHFLEQLTFDEIKVFLHHIGLEGGKAENDNFKNTMLLALRLRFRYLLTTAPQSVASMPDGSAKCNFCNSTIDTGICKNCLISVAKSCAFLYNQGFKDRALREHINLQDIDPFANLAIIGATCLLKLAGLRCHDVGSASAVKHVDVRLILQAISWLNSHYGRVSQKDPAITVFLTKLYLLIGCVPQAQLLWDTLGVKNVTLDSLGPLFSDRLSSIAPGMWRLNNRTPMNQYHYYFQNAIRKTIPANIRTALEHANYPSVLGLLETQQRLVHSCTMVMANVEDRRGLRAIGSKAAFDAKDDPLLRSIKSDKQLLNVTDNAALPNHECAPDTLADIVSIGPGLSDVRAKLSLYTEHFISLLSYKDAKEYKPTKAAQVADLDRAYVAETAEQIANQLEAPLITCLTGGEHLTTAELSYFTTINSLLRYVILSTRTSWTRNATRPSQTSDAMAQVASQLQTQIDLLQGKNRNLSGSVSAIQQFASLHVLGMLRESAQAVKLTANYLERAAVPFKNDMPKWLSEDAKTMIATVVNATNFVKKQVRLLNDEANASGWLDRVSEFAFGDLASGAQAVGNTPSDPQSGDLSTMVFIASGQKAGLEHTIGEIRDSWQEIAKGWNTVKLD